MVDPLFRCEFCGAAVTEIDAAGMTFSYDYECPQCHRPYWAYPGPPITVPYRPAPSERVYDWATFPRRKVAG